MLRYDGPMQHTNRLLIDGVHLETAHWPGPTDRAPLVFLHEGLGSVAMWTQAGRCWPAELCAATGRAGWAYSRRGYGASDPIPDVRGPHNPPPEGGVWHRGRHAPGYMAHEAHTLLPLVLAAWGVDKPVLVGHSDGATIALLHSADHPVSACVAMAPHVVVEPITRHAIEQAREAYLHTPLRDRLSRYHRDVDNAFWQWNDVWLSAGFAGFDIRSDCKRIRCPLMLVQGQDDAYGTLAQLDAIGAAAPHAQQRVLANCGHSPHRDQTDTLTSALQAWLAPLE
ncbi:MAG: hypothetical protein RJA09_2524 [Pseudomonadota bacterium]